MVSPFTSCCKNKRLPLTAWNGAETRKSRRPYWFIQLFDQLFGRYELAVLDHFNEGGFGTIALLVKVGHTGDTLVTIGFRVNRGQAVTDLFPVRTGFGNDLGQDTQTVIGIGAHPVHITVIGLFVTFREVLARRACRRCQEGNRAVSVFGRFAADFDVVFVINAVSTEKRTSEAQLTALAGDQGTLRVVTAQEDRLRLIASKAWSAEA